MRYLELIIRIVIGVWNLNALPFSAHGISGEEGSSNDVSSSEPSSRSDDSCRALGLSSGSCARPLFIVTVSRFETKNSYN